MIKTQPRIAGLILCAALFLGLSQQAAAGTVPQWELGAGVVGLLLPDYRGSDEVRSYVLPVPYIIYRLEWLTADRNGIRSTLLNREEAEVNLSMSATPPVRSKNNRAREGMSDIKPMVELGPSLDIHLWHGDGRRFKLDVRAPVRAAFTVESHPRDVGVSFSPTLNFDVAGIGGRPWQLGMLAGPIFATRRQHQYFYGVSESDARPERPAFDTDGGYAGLQCLVALSRRVE
ncbi:MAG: MipA/OmpV family protein, partial [Candidatus Deferrimicrobium sp.]|nr:MipA/OmpV family protein [Candidatus Deferrimicrobium sp.]